MALIGWPVALPQALLKDSFREAMVDNVIRDQPDIGPASRRPRATFAPWLAGGSMVMSSAQWDTLKSFCEDTLVGMTLPFGFPGPNAKHWFARMAAPPERRSIKEGFWEVSLQLEVLDEVEGIHPLVVSQPDTFYVPTVVRSPSIVYMGNATDTTDLTTYTFAAFAIGSASSDRLIAVAIHKDGAPATTINSVTIGGVTATRVQIGNGTGSHCCIAYAVVPTGTTADIVVTYDGVSGRCLIAVWALKALQSSTPIDSGTSNGSAGSHTAVLDLPTGSVGICAITNGNNAVSSSWNEGTERYDQSPEALCTASGTELRGIGANGVSVTATHTSDSSALVGITWQ